MAIGFYGNSKTQMNALKATGWCDTYFLKPNSVVGAVPGSVEELKKLNINFNKYDAALIFHDALSPAQQYFCDECIKHDVTIYANQHGFNKSILQISNHTPNIYSKYWNAMGYYFLDRFREVDGRDPIKLRWIHLGSILHDYLHKNFRWSEKNNNGRALVIHEPDLSICEGDPHPHNSEEITQRAITLMNRCGISVDLKPHPNWKNFIGSYGGQLKIPEGADIVDMEVEDIVNYALIVGSRSTMLLDAVAMGIPTLAVESSSAWKDDKYPPVEQGERGLIPTYSLDNFVKGLDCCFNQPPEYDDLIINYFLGPLGHVSENYYKFIKEDLKSLPSIP